MGRPFTCVLLIVLLALPAWPAIQSQQRDQQRDKREQGEETVKIGTELVQIDVVVTDRSGKLISNLKKDDFELLEDGKQQEISFFTVESQKGGLDPESNAPARQALQIAASNAPLGRNIVLIVDNIHTSPANLLRIKDRLTRFIEDDIFDDDRVAVVATSGGLGLLQQLTDDKDVMKRAVNRIGVGSRTTTDTERPLITAHHAELIDMGDRDALELSIEETIRELGLTGPDARAQAERIVRSRVTAILSQVSHTTKATLSTIESLIRSLKPLPGRKLTILVSDGFLVAGASARFSNLFDLRRITDAATRAGVVIYTIDSRGLIAPNSDITSWGPADTTGRRVRIENGEIEAMRGGLNALAHDTGGFPIFDNNDLNLGLRRALEDNSTYYVLAYYPANSHQDGKFRKITVKVKNREDLVVRTRKGYFAEEKSKKPQKEVKDPVEQIRAALSSPVPKQDLSVHLAANFINVKDRGPVALASIQLKGNDLSFASVNDRFNTEVDVVTLVHNSDGKLAANISRTLQLNLRPETYKRIVNDGLRYREVIPLNPGLYQVTVAVREKKSGLIGTASQWVHIPDLLTTKLALSDIFVGASRDDLLREAKDGEITRGQPLGDVARRFPRDSEIDFISVIYNQAQSGDKEKPDFVAQTQIFHNNVVVFTSPLRAVPVDGAEDLSQIPFAARLSLSDLPPGRYTLQLTVIDRSRKTHTSRRVKFTIE